MPLVAGASVIIGAPNVGAQFGAAGQLLAGTGPGTGKQLAVGSNGQVLTVGGADPSGLEWSNPANLALQYNDLQGWTFDPVGMTGGGGIVAAYVYLLRIPLPAAQTVTNVLTIVIVKGLTLANSFLGLYKSNGTVIGQTADQSAAWGAAGATGNYTLPLVGGPYTCTPLAANDFLWAAIYIGSFVTSPSFALYFPQTPSVNYMGTSVSRQRFAAQAVANTAILPSLNPANNDGPVASFWAGIS